MTKRFSALITVLFILFIIGAVYAGLSYEKPAFADSAELTVEQVEKVYYQGKDFLSEDKTFVGANDEKRYTFALYDGSSALYSALKFTYLKEEITVDPADVEFIGKTYLVFPDDYNFKVKVRIGGREYETSVKIVISKKPLYVYTKINGKDYYEVEEGEEYRTSIVYEGFVGSDNENTLTYPAIIQSEPKMATTGYQIVAELAESDRYEFIYVGATIVIKPNPKTEWKSDDEELTLTGSFNRYCKLKYENVGLNKNNPKYVAINEKVEKNFSGNRVFEEYEQACAYQINMELDGLYAKFTDPINVKIKVDNGLLGKKYYRVMHFFNDGSYEFLNATETSDGCISFSTTDLGDFVLLIPTEGVSKVVIAAFCIVGIGAVLFVVILFAIFRRKY